MRQKPGTRQSHGEKVVKDIRREGIAQSLPDAEKYFVSEGKEDE